jgi:hypothetical protein
MVRIVTTAQGRNIASVHPVRKTAMKKKTSQFIKDTLVGGVLFLLRGVKLD